MTIALSHAAIAKSAALKASVHSAAQAELARAEATLREVCAERRQGSTAQTVFVRAAYVISEDEQGGLPVTTGGLMTLIALLLERLEIAHAALEAAEK
jgi:hypothetical protein